MNEKYARILLLFVLVMMIAGLTFSMMGCGVAKDTQLQMTIKEELRKDRNVQHDKLIVNVKDGMVTISGELYTREEIDRVVEIVEGIEGVVMVKNHMSLPSNYNSINPTFLDPFN